MKKIVTILCLIVALVITSVPVYAGAGAVVGGSSGGDGV